MGSVKPETTGLVGKKDCSGSLLGELSPRGAQLPLEVAAEVPLHFARRCRTRERPQLEDVDITVVAGVLLVGRLVPACVDGVGIAIRAD